MRLEYQLEVKMWLYMEKIYREHLKFKPNTVKKCTCVAICTLLKFYVRNYCIPLSDCVCEGSGDSCTGMRSLNGV